MAPSDETPVQKACPEYPKCKKTYTTKGGLTRHVQTVHKVLLDNFLSPIASTARVLFATHSTTEDDSTQGNSHGQVTSPKLVSVGRYMCGDCDNVFVSNAKAVEHKRIEHDKAQAEKVTDISLNNEIEDSELVVLVEKVEYNAKAKEVDIIVKHSMDTLYDAVVNSKSIQKDECHECKLKDEKIKYEEKNADVKERLIEERSAAIKSLQDMARKHAIEKAAGDKRVIEADKIRKHLAEKTKEVESLKLEILTKDAIIALQNDESHSRETTNTVDSQREVEFVEEEVTVEAEVKKCKKCKFTASDLQVLGLHIENNHQGNQFECSECSQKFSFKNQLKLHRRQLHEEGTFSCFVCNNKFKTHRDLKQHIQRKCKDNSSNSQPRTAVPSNSVDIAIEDRYKCLLCEMVTNSQMSLLNHMRQKHQTSTAVNGNKCDVCSVNFQSRENLIKHIADNHVQNNNIINRHICARCNVEVHGDETRDNHMCRNPQYQCSGCKVKLFSKEAYYNHICPLHPNKSVDQQVRELNRSYTLCRWGDSCTRFSRGMCGYKHTISMVSTPQQAQDRTENPWRYQGRRHGGQQGMQPQVAGPQGGSRQGRGHVGGRQTGDLQEAGQQGAGQQEAGQQGAGQQGAGQQGQMTRSHGRPALWCHFQDRCNRRNLQVPAL